MTQTEWAMFVCNLVLLFFNFLFCVSIYFLSGDAFRTSEMWRRRERDLVQRLRESEVQLDAYKRFFERHQSEKVQLMSDRIRSSENL